MSEILRTSRATSIPKYCRMRRPGKTDSAYVKIDGRRMVEAGALIRLVSKHKVGDSLEIEFRRGGQYRTTKVVLQPMPAKIPTGRPSRKPAPRPATQPAGKPAAKPTTRPTKKAA